jgi:hypothetical protein
MLQHPKEKKITLQRIAARCAVCGKSFVSDLFRKVFVVAFGIKRRAEESV